MFGFAELALLVPVLSTSAAVSYLPDRQVNFQISIEDDFESTTFGTVNKKVKKDHEYDYID